MKKVLIAHPDAELRKTVRGHLEHHGYHVECAGDAAETIRLGLTFAPAVLVTARDLAQETSGLKAAEALHRHIENLHVILTVAPADLDALEEYSQHLPHRVLLAEPVDADALLAQLEEI